MTLRHIAKRLLPPVLADILRGRRVQSRGNWRGIYDRLADVPTLNPEFGDGLINEMAVGTRTALDQIRAGRKPYLWHEALALVAGGVAASRGRVRVLDFGGGLGTGYLQLITCLPSGTDIEYHIIDNKEMCGLGQALFQSHTGIHFSTQLPDTSTEKPDIVYVNSVLQYIEDYAAQLRSLASFGSHHILLARLAAGDCPTFAAEQINVPSQILPYWFLNVGEVAAIMGNAGYHLICDELTERSYDQSVYPETHRVEKFRNMLFTRSSHTPR